MTNPWPKQSFTPLPSDATPKRGSKRKLAASHQRSWLWGRNAVCETLQAGRWPIVELLVADDLPLETMDTLLGLAAIAGFTPERVSTSRLSQLCGSSEHQGVVARVAEFSYGQVDDWQQLITELLTRQLEPKSHAITSGTPDHLTAAAHCAASKTPIIPSPQPHPLFVICDRIQDAHNFGAILRCCEGVGADAVLLGSREQASVTPHVARSSAGAVNYLNLFRVDDLVAAAARLRSAGVTLIAASEKSEQQLWHSELNRPVAVIIGSEACGIRPQLLELCDLTLRIPMLGRTTSLNAAVAAGVTLYEIRRQQAG